MGTKDRFELRKYVAPEFIFGHDAISLTAEYLLKFGAKKVFIVTDKVVRELEWVNSLVDKMQSEGMKCTIFDNVSPNPRDNEVMEGSEEYKISGSNVILAVGGGSVLDCAKGIGIVVSNNRHILDFEGVDRVTVPIPPLICIPTTAGSSADVSQFCIIKDDIEKVKKAIISKAVVPDLALIDPKAIVSMDPMLTAHTGLDALVHAIEAFVSNASSHFTDMHAIEAIKLIKNNLLLSIKHPDNLVYRGNMMLASLQAGLAFSNASLGAVHAMSHSLGGYLDLAHGQCNALLLEHVVNYNYKNASDRMNKIAKIYGAKLKGLTSREKNKELFSSLRQFRLDTGVTETLQNVGVSKSFIPQLALKAHADPCLVTNPRRAVVRDIEVIYEEAL